MHFKKIILVYKRTTQIIMNKEARLTLCLRKYNQKMIIINQMKNIQIINNFQK